MPLHEHLDLDAPVPLTEQQVLVEGLGFPTPMVGTGTVASAGNAAAEGMSP